MAWSEPIFLSFFIMLIDKPHLARNLSETVGSWKIVFRLQ